MVSDTQRKEIEELYHAMHDTLLYYAQLHAKDLAPAEDIVQEAYHIACSNPDDLLSSANPKGWMIRTVNNVIRNLKRRNFYRQETLHQLQYLSPISGEDPVDLHILYGPLADTEDFKLLLAQGNGDSVKVLAEDLGISESACKKRLQRAREALKKIFFEF